MLTLIGGGARSGKSAFAQRYAEARPAPRLFIATAQPFDDEMRARIERHRADRADRFVTVEEPHALPEAIAAAPASAVVLVDCLTLWLSNLLLADLPEAEILARVEAVAHAAVARSGVTLVVTNEVGMGLVPETPLGRAFRDLAGKSHQRLAAVADEIYAAWLGVILRLRPSPLITLRPGDLP